MFVKQWMGTEVVTIAPGQTIAEALQQMQAHRIRRLPVVENGILVGVVSPNDLEKVMPSILEAENRTEQQFVAEHTEVRAVMTSSPVTVGPDDTLVEAIRRMRHHKIDGLPVVEEKKLVGILSITDILDAFLELMPGGRAGTRFDLKIDHAPESFYKLVKAFQRQNKEILAISQHHGFSTEYQLLSVHIRETDNEDLIDLLWQNNVKVERISQVS
jgi:acetoin utilization protein AcuB